MDVCSTYYKLWLKSVPEQISRELGVSASYLSQVGSGKRPASAKLLNSINGISVKQKVKQKGSWQRSLGEERGRIEAKKVAAEGFEPTTKGL